MTRNRFRQVGLLRSIARRSRSDWPLVLASWLLLACATSLITASATYSESVALGGFHRMIEASSPSTSAVRVKASLPGETLAAADAAVARTIGDVLGAGSGSTSLIATTDSLSLAGVDPNDSAHQIRVGSYGAIADHAALTSGHWPAAGATPIEATLSVGAASAMGLRIGDRVNLTSKLDTTRSVPVAIVGLWQPAPGDRYWLDSGLELNGLQTVATSTTRGPFVVTAADLRTLAGTTSLNAEWRWLPAIDGLRPADADPMRAAIAALPDRIAAAYPDTFTYVSSGLPDTLAAATKSLLVARSSTLLLFIQFTVMAIYAILLVAGMLVERRRPESALLRSRGAGSLHVAMLAMGEAVLLAIPAVAVAPFVAQAVVRLLGAVGPLASANVIAPVGIDGTTVMAAVGAGLGCVAVLTLPALPGMSTLSGVRAALSRQVGKTLAQRLGLDLAMVVVAAIAVWQLRTYGAPLTRTVRGDLGIDPLLVAAPAIGMLAGALVATRLIPRLGEVGERILGRGRGLTGPLLARQLGRRPLRYTRLALLLMLAASFGTFAAMFSATWDRSQADQAAYETATDIRLTVTGHSTLPGWAFGPAYGAVPDVQSAVPVRRGPFDVGRAVPDGQLIAIDSARLGGLSSLPAGALGDSPASAVGLLAKSPVAPMVTLPGRPVRMAVDINAALAVEGADPDNPDPNVADSLVEVSVVIADSNGIYRFDAGTVPLSAPQARAVADLTRTVGGVEYRPAFPLRVEAIELKVAGYYPVTGSLELLGIETLEGGSPGEWTSVNLPLGSADWGWAVVSRQRQTAYPTAPGRPGAISLGHEAADIQFDPAQTYRYWAWPKGPAAIPALGNQALLDESGSLVGDIITASRSGFESPLRIAALVSSFPTLDPDKPILIVDRAALDLIDYATWGVVDNPTEWWLTVKPGSETAVAAALEGGAYSVATAVTRAQAEAARRADPIALGVIGALLLGTIAAIALAAIGFLVTIAFMARERSGELALLRALGQSARGVSAMLAAEAAALLAYGLIAGAALGLLIGWLAIPFASLTPAGGTPVPTPSLEVPWVSLAALALPLTVLLWIGAAVLIRLAAATPIASALRSREVEP
jgi:hypothetical protein